MSRKLDIAVLIPAHDEAEAIHATVKAALSVPGVTRIVVVDDGSEDGTDVWAEKAGAKVVRMAGNAGKGGALEAGYRRVENADIIVLLDGDLGTTAAQAERLIGPVRDGRADMAIATFPATGMTAGFGLVKGMARFGIHSLGSRDFEARAPLSGQRAIAGPLLEVIRPFAPGYGVEVALTIRALQAGARVEEVPTEMSHAATGRDIAGFVHRGRQFVHVGLAMIKLTFKKRLTPGCFAPLVFTDTAVPAPGGSPGASE